MANIDKYELYVQKYLLSDTYFIHSSLRKGLTSSWFTEGISFYFSDCIIEHYKTTGGLLTKSIVVDILESNKISESTISLYETYIDSIYALEDDKDTNFDYWFAKLKSEYLGRNLKTTLSVVVDDIKLNRDYKKSITLLDYKIGELKKQVGDFEEGFTLRESAEDRWNRYQDVKEHPEKYIGIQTGYRNIDEPTSGLLEGELAIVIARSGMGKSIFLNNIGRNAYINGCSVLYAGIEMNPELSIKRLDSLMADVPMTFLRNGKLSEEEEERYKQILDVQKKMENEYYIVPQNQCRTPEALDLEIKNFKNKYGKLDLVIVDYLNIMTLNNTKGMAAHEVQKSLVEEVRWLAIQHQLPIFTAAQQNRESLKSDNKDTSMISGSDFIGNTADLCVCLFEDKDDSDNGLITCEIIKGRNIECSKFKLRKNFKRMLIADFDEFDGVAS